MVIKKKSIIIFLFSLIPIFYQLFNLEVMQVKYVPYIPLILLVTIGIPLIKLKKTIKQNKLIILPVFINFIVVPLISFNLGKFSLGTELLNIFLQILLLLVILVVVGIVDDKDTLLRLAKATLITNSIILTTEIIINFNEVVNIDNYMWFVSERLERAVYGFSHANTASSFIFVELILLVLVYSATKKKILILPILFFLPPLVATGSRTAIIGFTIFIVIYTIIKIISFWEFNIRFTIIPLFIIGFFIAVLKFDWSFLLESSSGRDTRVTYNLQYLLEHHLIWFGIGPINNTNIQNVMPQLFTIDNWYVNNTILYGMFGTLSFLTVAALLIFKYLKHAFLAKNTRTFTWGFAFLVSFLIYSVFETFLYTPGVLASILFWVFVLSILNNKSNFTDEFTSYKNTKRKKYRLTW